MAAENGTGDADRGPGDDPGPGGQGSEASEAPVGYCSPPRHTRWKKGQSGNPAGRPKSARGLKTDLRAELVSRMDIRMNGEVVSGTRQQLMLRTLSARAASGDIRATRILIDLVMQVFGPEDHGGGEKRLSAQDQQILDELLSRKAVPSAPPPGQQDPAASSTTPDPASPAPDRPEPGEATDHPVDHEENDCDPDHA